MNSKASRNALECFRFEDDGLVPNNPTLAVVVFRRAIEVDGSGMGLTTAQCLLNKNRNPQLSKHEITECLRNYLGITHLVWLGEGISGDDTNGHVDDIARFVSPGKVICMIEEDPSDENHNALKKNYEMLQESKLADGSLLEVIPLKMPRKVLDEDGKRLPASYVNFYIGNDVVLVPIFGGKNDESTLSVLSETFYTRNVIGINCTGLIYGFGGIHCVTQQQPAI